MINLEVEAAVFGFIINHEPGLNASHGSTLKRIDGAGTAGCTGEESCLVYLTLLYSDTDL